MVSHTDGQTHTSRACENGCFRRVLARACLQMLYNQKPGHARVPIGAYQECSLSVMYSQTATPPMRRTGKPHAVSTSIYGRSCALRTKWLILSLLGSNHLAFDSACCKALCFLQAASSLCRPSMVRACMLLLVAAPLHSTCTPQTSLLCCACGSCLLLRLGP